MRMITVNGVEYRRLYGKKMEELLRIYDNSKEIQRNVIELRKEMLKDEVESLLDVRMKIEHLYDGDIGKVYIESDSSLKLLHNLTEAETDSHPYCQPILDSCEIDWRNLGNGISMVADELSRFMVKDEAIMDMISLVFQRIWESDVEYHNEYFADMVDTGDFFTEYFVDDNGNFVKVEAEE